MLKQKWYKINISVIIISLLLFGGVLTNAQTAPQVIITWQAYNYYPSDYSGKALPTTNTSLLIAAEVIKNGKLIDLSNADFIWYADETPIIQGRGIKETLFSINKPAGDNYFIRVAINLNGEKFESSLRIPVKKHKIVIENRYPNQLIPAASQVFLETIPYFFNITSLQDLKFSWRVIGQEKRDVDENQLVLNVGTPQFESERTIQIDVSAYNKLNPSEFASDNTKLVVY